MAKITSLSIESNLGFTFDRQAAASDTTLYLKFFNRVTGAATEPIAANRTNLIVVADKGSEGSPNPNYEIMVLGTVGAASGGVSTCTNVIRGVTFSTTAITAGTGKIHQAGSVGGCADVADLWWQMYRVFDGTYATNANTLRVGDETAADIKYLFQNDQADKPYLYYDESGGRPRFHIGSDALGGLNQEWEGVIPIGTTAQLAAMSDLPTLGMVAGDTTLGEMVFREGGAWVQKSGGGSVANGSTTVAGKFEEATVAEQGTATATGGTGSRLVLAAANLVKTSSGASDENKIAVLNSSGQFATGFLASNLQAIASTGSTNVTGTELETLSSSANASALHWHSPVTNIRNSARHFYPMSSAVLTAASGTATNEGGSFTLVTQAANNAIGKASIGIVPSGTANYFHGKNPAFVVRTMYAAATAQEGFVGFADASFVGTSVENSVFTLDHMGFVIQDGTVYGSCADGTTQSKTAALTVTITNETEWAATFDGTTVTFYINGTSVGTLTTNLPDGVNGLVQLIACVIADASGAAKTLYVYSMGGAEIDR